MHLFSVILVVVNYKRRSHGKKLRINLPYLLLSRDIKKEWGLMRLAYPKSYQQ